MEFFRSKILEPLPQNFKTSGKFLTHVNLICFDFALQGVGFVLGLSFKSIEKTWTDIKDTVTIIVHTRLNFSHFFYMASFVDIVIPSIRVEVEPLSLI